MVSLPAFSLPGLAIIGEGSIVQFVYMASALLFILGIKRLSGVKTARSGNGLASLAMLLAVAATLVSLWGEGGLAVIAIGMAIGGISGALLAKRIPMTAMPELVAVLNGFGGLASLAVALAEVEHFRAKAVEAGTSATLNEFTAGGTLGGPDFAIAIVLSILIGAVTFSGSLVAYGKLSGKIKGSRFGPLGSLSLNGVLAAGAIAVAIWAGYFATSDGPTMLGASLAVAVVALILGVGLVIAIGGADMPVVISLLNSYSGLAAAMTGFVLKNNLLIVAGSLVGASGLILTKIMCKAMNRSLANVLFGGFGETSGATQEDSEYTSVRSTSAEEVAPILDAAESVVIVPGYGLAVAQAQHKVRELADLLEAGGCNVSYGIHPVAGRMPGHMNVLLAEADVPYEQLFDLDQIQGEFKNTDVVIVVGANDVCNPASSDPTSAIAGMPVLNVWEAQTIVVIKRSLSAGYAGIKNELFQMDNSLMLFGDAKKALEDLVTEVKDQ